MITAQPVDGERTKDVYEGLSWCPKPPLITLPEFDYFISTEHSGFQYRLPNWLVKACWTALGFKAFYKRLPQCIDEELLASNASVSLESGIVHAATLTLEDDSRNLGPIERAATLLFALQNLYEDLSSGDFEPDQHRGQILETRQYLNLFSTCFIIENGRQRIFKSTNTSHILVILDGRFYYLRVGTLKRETTFRQLRDALAEIVERARSGETESESMAPGILTCAKRSTQLEVFPRLQGNEVNARSLSAVRHCKVILCLDLAARPSSDSEAALAAHSRNCRNRWFHSSLQLVVFGNGRACMIAHPGAYLPGNTMMRGAYEIQRRALKYPEENEVIGQFAPLPPAQELEWEIEQEVIAQAHRELESVRDEQQATFEILGIGKNLFTLYELPAVPVFIIALQLAVMRLTNRMVAIRQFLDMSTHRSMSLATAVVTTKEVMDCVEYIARGDVKSDQAMYLLRKAIDSQLQKCRNVRKYLPFSTAFSIFLRSSERPNKKLQQLRMRVVTWIWSIFHKLKIVTFAPIEVLVSHPKIYPGISTVGRPGIRFPYVKDFGLHYQIHDDKIVATVMPSIHWAASNRDLIAALQESLVQIRRIAGEARGNDDSLNGVTEAKLALRMAKSHAEKAAQ